MGKANLGFSIDIIALRVLVREIQIEFRICLNSVGWSCSAVGYQAYCGSMSLHMIQGRNLHPICKVHQTFFEKVKNGIHTLLMPVAAHGQPTHLNASLVSRLPNHWGRCLRSLNRFPSLQARALNIHNLDRPNPLSLPHRRFSRPQQDYPCRLQ